MVTILIENKADINVRTRNGLGNDPEYANKTARDIAKLRNHKACEKIIREYLIKNLFKNFINSLILAH